jgi:hypothetical protein
LQLRGSSDFADLDSYRGFVDEVVGRANVHRRKALEIERARLTSLPQQRLPSELSRCSYWLKCSG